MRLFSDGKKPSEFRDHAVRLARNWAAQERRAVESTVKIGKHESEKRLYAARQIDAFAEMLADIDFTAPKGE